MIARLWRGWTSKRNADPYESVLRTQVIPGIHARRIAGFQGIEVFRRDAGDEVEFMTAMRFDSLEAVRAFAGEDYEIAVVPPAALGLLRRFDERSVHYEIRLQRPTQLHVD